MSHGFDAIYEHGVFRPLERVDLPEHTTVRLQMQEKGQTAAENSDKASGLVGLLSDEPGLVDQILDDVYHSRDTQRLRTPRNASRNP